MNVFNIWVDLVNGHEDLEFAEALNLYLGHMAQEGLIESFSLERRKLGLGPQELGEFHVRILTKNLAQLDEAFDAAAARTGEVERLHANVFRRVKNYRAAIYRTFPDPVRVK